MQLLANTHFDFMKYKKQAVVLSTIVNILGLGIFAYQYFANTLNVGIDFKGGTEIQVKFAKAVAVGDVRQALEQLDLKGASVTTIGGVAENEIYVRLPLQAGETQALIDRVKAALRRVVDNPPAPPPGMIDLNVADEKTIAEFLIENGRFVSEEAKAAASAISDLKKRQGGIIRGLEELQGLAGANSQILSWLPSKSALSPFSIRSQNSVEGAISKELARKAVYAVIGSMMVMLVYIWIRFRFQWGLGAIVALVHDVIVTMGIFCLLGKEWSIPVVASFLTLTGYSVNDTIVMFDRVRENLKKKGAGKLEEVINTSINQTLSRTLITAGLTWMVVVCLYLFGGEVLNAFAFVLVIGLIVGTYSSIFIAAPIIIFWEKLFAKNPAPTGPARARARA